MSINSSPRMRAGQSGITLVIALIMLTVLTLIGITVANMTTVDLKIATNKQGEPESDCGCRKRYRFPDKQPRTTTAFSAVFICD